LGYKYAKAQLSLKSYQELNLHKDKVVELSSVLNLLLIFLALTLCSIVVVISEVMYCRWGSLCLGLSTWRSSLRLLLLDLVSKDSKFCRIRRLMSRRRWPPPVGTVGSVIIVKETKLTLQTCDFSRGEGDDQRRRQRRRTTWM